MMIRVTTALLVGVTGAYVLAWRTALSLDETAHAGTGTGRSRR